MGLNNRVFELIAMHCRRGVARGTIAPTVRPALAAGYPDCLVDPAMLRKWLGTDDMPADRASNEIKRMHARPLLDYARDPFHVFRMLGFDLTVIDIAQERGPEQIVDLNKPSSVAGSFDLVLDHGTIEHCFNVAEAARNLAGAVAGGGFIVQHLPMNMYNHGFYNFSPTFFVDFYEQNGFDILHMEGVAGDRVFDVPPVMRFRNVPENSLITIVARRVVVQAITFPIQRVYRERVVEARRA